MFVSAILLAAGKSKRLKNKVSKVVLELNSRPVISYSLDCLNEHPQIKEIVVVGNRKNIENLKKVIKQNKVRKAAKVILGGARRQDSVLNGLNTINPKADYVLIHDAARPFITKGLISSVLNEARITKAAIVGVPVKATIKSIRASVGRNTRNKMTVNKTLDRSKLWEVQTPQAFSKKLILKAFRDFGSQKVTDDAMLVEKSGKKVKMVLGSNYNIKITTPEDLIIAKGIAQLWKPA